MEPIFRSLSTSSFTALARSGPSFLHLCLTGLNVGSTFRSWEVILMSIPGMSVADHAIVLIICLRKDKRSCLTSGGRSFPMLTPFSWELSSRATTLDRSLAGFFYREITDELDVLSSQGNPPESGHIAGSGLFLAPMHGFSPVDDKNFKH